jgi:hypothetical protein
MKKLSKKDPLHRIKGFPEIYFYEAPGRSSLPAIMPGSFIITNAEESFLEI